MITSAFALFAAAENGSTLLRLLGRFHPAIVHFPIALLTLAALCESWQIVRRKSGVAAATPLCLGVGAASAVLASLFGLLFEEFDGGSGGSMVDIHKWVGIAATAVALVAVVLLLKAAASPKALAGLRAFLFTGAALVGLTGYLGGELVFGSNHLLKGILDPAKPATPDSPEKPTPVLASATPPAGKVDFASEVKPILTGHCLQCHGGEKTRGKLDIRTKADTMKGGKNGPCIIPGNAEGSSFFVRMVDQNPDMKMPPPRQKQLSAEQIAIIRRWIEQGADWPDDMQLARAE